MRAFILSLVLAPFVLQGQVNSTQLKSLNAVVEYANQSADHANSIVKSIIDIYPQLQRKANWPKYVCPTQLDDYYFTQAFNGSNKLTGKFTIVSKSLLPNFRKADEALDRNCKALETYYKLEDYKSDNFKRAEELVDDIQKAIANYKVANRELNSFILSVKATEASPAGNAYKMADDKMNSVIVSEAKMIDSWNFNLNESIHTGWPDENMKQSIALSQQAYTDLKSKSPELKYPASSMWSQFQESLNSIIEIKKRSIDDYNFEAKKNDKHSNDVYLEMINYFNGTLIADYNTFIQFAERDGFAGVRALKYVGAFEIRTQSKNVAMNVDPFKDVPHVQLVVKDEKFPIPPNIFKSLSGYVDLVNETWRQTNYLQLVLRSFNGSALSFKKLQNFDRRAPMHFDYRDFKSPQSLYLETVRLSAALPLAYSKPLNDQVETLMSILKEMDQLAASLDNEVTSRRYEQDRLTNVFKILERESELFRIWDERKEVFYNDIRRVYNSFPPANPSSSWQVSGRALRELSDLDHEILFQAKAFYAGDSLIKVQTAKVDQSVRDVISKEFENMKGIQKIGRNNGLCPYTPYEDLPETSRRLSEASQKLKPAGDRTDRSHPYHSLVYLYNDIVDDYNKFCELSTQVPHLKTIKQPELFAVTYPDAAANDNKPVIAGRNELKVSTAESGNGDGSDEKSKASKNDPTVLKEKEIFRDTIYITKRDTVYISGQTENLRSMEGYASNNLILLLDVSGSMNQPEKLPLLKRSMLDLISMMREEDRVSIIVFSGRPRLVLKSSSFTEGEKIKAAVNDLSSSGKTDGNAAIKLAYKVADENYLRGGNNRIVLATDGDFSLRDETVNLIEKFSKQDIFLSIFNFGKSPGASKSLERLASLGKGNFESIAKENIDLKLIREVKAKKK